jgi:CubicO group peptidase (beta-lactamase class C family)
MTQRMVMRALAAAIMVAAAGCAARSRPVLPVAPPAELGLDAAVLAGLEDDLQAFVDSGRVSGIYAVVARGGRIGWERTFGWRDVQARDRLRRDDIFRIYSMTKPVVAAGMMVLVERGLVRLDDPVSRYIPSFAAVRVYAGGPADAPVLEDATSPITVRMLLNHTSGLAYGLTTSPADSVFARARMYDARHTLELFADSVARLPLLFQPGSRWGYSSGLDVAARVIEVASGTTVDRFLDDAIFRPLRMRDTGFRIRPGTRGRLATVYAPGTGGPLTPVSNDGLLAMFEPDARFFWGSGGLLATPDDFLQFAHMLLNGGELDGVRVLAEAGVAQLTENSLAPELTPVSYGSVSDGTYGFGLGLAVRVDTARAGSAARPGPVGLYRWSGYLGTYFWVDPANDLVAMVWTQLSPGSRAPTEALLQRAVYDALVAGRSP